MGKELVGLDRAEDPPAHRWWLGSVLSRLVEVTGIQAPTRSFVVHELHRRRVGAADASSKKRN